MEDRIVVYTSENCPYCERVKEILTEYEAPFKEKNITLNERHYKEWKSKDVVGTPVTYYKDAEVIGVNKKQLLEIVNMYKSSKVN